MNKTRVVLAIGAIAYAFEIVRRFSVTTSPVDTLVWAALGGFAFWKAFQAPARWCLTMAVFFLCAAGFQAYLLSSYLKAKGNPGFWHALVPMLAPLVVVAICFFIGASLNRQADAS
ncbi:MAG: hypothetical protein QM790_00070 [Nibricoccus sp.]